MWKKGCLFGYIFRKTNNPMSKIYIKAEMQIVVESDLQDVNDIMDNVTFDMTSANRDAVEVYDATITKFVIDDAK